MITALDMEVVATQSFEDTNDGRLKSPAAARRLGETIGKSGAPDDAKPKAKFGGLVIEQKVRHRERNSEQRPALFRWFTLACARTLQALPVIRRSPSWSHPGDRADRYWMSGKISLKKVKPPQMQLKILMYFVMILINNLMVFATARIIFVEYLQIETTSMFGGGLKVTGLLTAQSVEVTVDQVQTVVFSSHAATSAATIQAAQGQTSKLILGKTSSPDWALSSDATDRFQLTKGTQPFFEVDVPSKTSTVLTHFDMRRCASLPCLLFLPCLPRPTTAPANAQRGLARSRAVSHCLAFLQAMDGCAGSVRACVRVCGRACLRARLRACPQLEHLRQPPGALYRRTASLGGYRMHVQRRLWRGAV